MWFTLVIFFFFYQQFLSETNQGLADFYERNCDVHISYPFNLRNGLFVPNELSAIFDGQVLELLLNSSSL
uniref:Putative secreted protein n=1 Tax=Anopheles darlingi TaxID=43151 RepID=A0A2M4DPM4_ANODA